MHDKAIATLQACPGDRWLFACLLLILLGAASWSNLSYADESGTDLQRLMPKQERANPDIGSGDAANIARSVSGGRVLSVHPAGREYKVKVLKPDGIVRNIRVDRTTGRVKSRK